MEHLVNALFFTWRDLTIASLFSPHAEQAGENGFTIVKRIRGLPQGLLVLARHKVAENIASLFGAQLLNFVLPLVLIPYLTRTLHPDGWGLVAIAQSFAAYLSVVIEYGFNLSAAREIAVHKASRRKLSDIFANVTAAKLFLIIVSGIIAILIMTSLDVYAGNKMLFWFAILFAIMQGASPLWFLYGLEELQIVALFEGGGKILTTVAILVFVNAPADTWLVMALYAISATLATITGYWLVSTKILFVRPTIDGIKEQLKQGVHLFVYRCFTSLYSTGNAFVLGLFVAPVFVGYYVGAEKIVRAIVSLQQPISRALYPRLSHLVQHNRQRAAHFAKITLALMGTSNFVGGLLLIRAAPWVVELLLGSEFKESVAALRIMALLPFVVSVSLVLGIQWMVPLGMDRVFSRIIVLAGLLNLTLAYFLAPNWAHIGMAWAVLLSQVFVTAGTFLLLDIKRLAPWSSAEQLSC